MRFAGNVRGHGFLGKNAKRRSPGATSRVQGLYARFIDDLERADAALGHALDFTRPARGYVTRLHPVVDHRAVELEGPARLRPGFRKARPVARRNSWRRVYAVKPSFIIRRYCTSWYILMVYLRACESLPHKWISTLAGAGNGSRGWWFRCSTTGSCRSTTRPPFGLSGQSRSTSRATGAASRSPTALTCLRARAPARHPQGTAHHVSARPRPCLPVDQHAESPVRRRKACRDHEARRLRGHPRGTALPRPSAAVSVRASGREVADYRGDLLRNIKGIRVSQDLFDDSRATRCQGRRNRRGKHDPDAELPRRSLPGRSTTAP